MLPTKFLYLKHLTIFIRDGTISPSYDYFSLVSFFDASPSLETLFLDVSHCSSYPAKIPGHSVGYMISVYYSSSGISDRYEAWISFWRFLTFEATAWTPTQLPQECGDHRVQLCEELGWASMLHCQERSLTGASYIRHPSWLREMYWGSLLWNLLAHWKRCARGSI